MPKPRLENCLSLLSVLALLGVLVLFNRFGSEYQVRILNLVGIFISLAVSYNLINGVTGQFSLAPNAFIALGAYTAALLTLTPEEKRVSFIIVPLALAPQSDLPAFSLGPARWRGWWRPFSVF